MKFATLASLISFTVGLTSVAALGSVKIVNCCGDYALYQSRVGLNNATFPDLIDAGKTVTKSFNEARPDDPAANHTLVFDVWPGSASDKRKRQDDSGSPDFNFDFLIWQVTVQGDSLEYVVVDGATDPFNNMTWKLASEDVACAACRSINDCHSEGCSAEKDVVLELCI